MISKATIPARDPVKPVLLHTSKPGAALTKLAQASSPGKTLACTKWLTPAEFAMIQGVITMNGSVN